MASLLEKESSGLPDDGHLISPLRAAGGLHPVAIAVAGIQAVDHYGFLMEGWPRPRGRAVIDERPSPFPTPGLRQRHLRLSATASCRIYMSQSLEAETPKRRRPLLLRRRS
jgi:hypothetical protein